MVSNSRSNRSSDLRSALLSDRLKAEAGNLLGALGERAVARVSSATDRLTDYAEQGGGPGLSAAITGAKKLAEGKSPLRAAMSSGTAAMSSAVGGLFDSGKSKSKGGGQGLKVTNIAESIDVGVPVRMAYDQWTQFRDFPSFMKKVEGAEQEADEKLTFKAQVFWSHRTWESTIMQQIPDQRIIWRSKGQKGHVDGAVTFHELAPDLTRILVALEYYPQGFFEQTGNLWRAQGRRARLELKHFRRHLMSHVLLDPDDLEGWRGVIEDGQVVKDHETAVREEREQQNDDYADEDDGGDDRYEDKYTESDEDDQYADEHAETDEDDQYADEHAETDEDDQYADDDDDETRHLVRRRHAAAR